MSRAPLLAFAGALALLLLLGAPSAAAQDPTPAPEWVDAQYDVRFEAVPTGVDDAGGGPANVTLEAVLAFHEVDFDGQSASADEVREQYEQGFIGDARIEEFERTVTSEFEQTMSSRLPLEGSPDVEPAEVDNSTLKGGSTGGDPYNPPILVNVSGEGVLDLAGIAGSDVSRSDLGLALELGASFDVPASRSAEAGWNTTTRIHAPEGLTWTEGTRAQVSRAGDVATTTVTNWDSAGPADPQDGSATVTNPDEKAYSTEEVSLNVTVDLEGVDIQLTSLVGGSLGEGKGQVTVDGRIESIALPDSAPAALTDAGVTHISASDIRLLVAEDVVNRSTLEDKVDNLTSGYTDDIPEEADVLLRGGLVEGTLETQEGVEDETARPIRIQLKADVTMDLAFSGGGQAVTFHTIDRSFTFPPIQDRPTGYEVVLPKGVVLEGVDAPTANPTTGTTEDGRDFFSLHVDEGEEHTATVHLAFTEGTLWHQAPELVALLVLLLLLPIVLVAWLVYRRGGDEGPTRVEAPSQDKPP